MKTEEEIFNELKALLANYPEQRVDLQEVHRYTILAGEYQVYNEGIEGESLESIVLRFGKSSPYICLGN